MERVTEWKIERRFLILKMDKKLPKINYEKLLVFYLQITNALFTKNGERNHTSHPLCFSVFLCVRKPVH